MRVRSIRTSVVVAAIAALVAGCGGSSSGGDSPAASGMTPAAELAAAVRALGDAHTLDLTLSLGASGADLLQIASGLGGDGPTKAQADAIGNDHIGIELQAASGKTLRDGLPGSAKNGGAFALTLGDDSKDYFAIQSVGGTLYGRVDLRYFLGLINGAPSYSYLQHQLARAPAFLHDAVAGGWITLPAATLKSLTGLAGGQLAATPTAGALRGLRSKLLSTLLADLQVTRASTGDADALDVTFQLRELLSDAYAVIAPPLESVVPRAPDGGSPLPGLNLQNIPDVAVHLDAYVTDGALSKLELDAGQFDTKEHISVPIDLNISQSGPTITAPSRATPIDLTSLGRLFAGT